MINPIVIFEVLSETTENYDRGEKFRLYRGLESLEEYVLISQTSVHIERFHRQEDESWNVGFYTDLSETIEFESVPSSLKMSEVYDDVQFTTVKS
ncbi:MAG: hypothetical protein CMJ78_15545 [Planctomycetaceae bacterium]|nr:hypothetical protein [Planctomycetaceae bacterium]